MAKAIFNGISGVARKVKQPDFGVGGVARKVKNAFIGIGGVARQCFSGVEMITITMTGNGNADCVYITINGVKYYSAGTITVPKGSEMVCYVYAYNSTSHIYVNNNNTPVKSTEYKTYQAASATYTHIVNVNTNVAFQYIENTAYDIIATTIKVNNA